MTTTLAAVDGGASVGPSVSVEQLCDTCAACCVLGEVTCGSSVLRVGSLRFRRCLKLVADLGAGEMAPSDDVRSLRPAAPLPRDAITSIVGRRLAEWLIRGDEVTLRVLR